MNKKYIDFVPGKSAKKSAGVGSTKSVVRAKSVSGVQKPAARKLEPKNTASKQPAAVRTRSATVRPAKATPQRSSASKSAAREAKSKKVGLRETQLGKVVPVEKPVEKSAKVSKTMAIPRTPFINQNKVEKRPLSKNVYQRKVEPTKEPLTGPVTIISKPEKDKHVSVVVTIIITIILGAAAGTVAFLLLPK